MHHLMWRHMGVLRKFEKKEKNRNVKVKKGM